MNDTIEIQRSWLETLVSRAKMVENSQESQKQYEVAGLLGFVSSAEYILKRATPRT